MKMLLGTSHIYYIPNLSTLDIVLRYLNFWRTVLVQTLQTLTLGVVSSLRAHVFSVCLMASANSSHRRMEEEKMKCLNFHPPSQPEAMVCNLPTHHLSCKPFGQTTSLLSIYITTFQFLFIPNQRGRSWG